MHLLNAYNLEQAHISCAIFLTIPNVTTLSTQSLYKKILLITQGKLTTTKRVYRPILIEPRKSLQIVSKGFRKETKKKNLRRSLPCAPIRTYNLSSLHTLHGLSSWREVSVCIYKVPTPTKL